MLLALIRKAVLGHTYSISDRIAVIEKGTDAIVWREVSETAEELKKFDCIVVSDRGLGGIMLEEQINIVFDMNLTGLWIATPNGLHQKNGFEGKFVPWNTPAHKAYYGQVENVDGIYYDLSFELWDGIVMYTKLADLVRKATQK